MVIKRNGQKVEFEKSKIREAVKKAWIEVKNGINNKGNSICDYVADEIETEYKELKDEMSVEEIQNRVEDLLMDSGEKQVARAYIRYRYKRELVRESNTTDKDIKELLEGNSDYWNTENSNKNAKIVTVQRDYIAGITSTDIARRFIFPKDVIKAHDKGIIHKHDMDYMAQRTLTNCFSSDTKFVTSEGIKSFQDFYDGSPVTVRDKNGQWRIATVHYFGKDILYRVTLKSGRSEKVVRCTKNHRWILANGEVTQNLTVGDTLYPLHQTEQDSNFIPKSDEELKAFCLGFVIGDGSDIGSNRGVRVRLCGEKTKYKDYFEKAGYQITNIKNTTDIIAVNKDVISKKSFIEFKMWKVMSTLQKRCLFFGYYSADGAKQSNSISTSNKNLAEMIQDISAIAGYYIASCKYLKHDTPYKENAELYTINFRKKQNNNNLWKVVDIVKDCNNNSTSNVWCVTEPITHSFTLENGIVTGNCCLINLEDMLQNGTVINGVSIEKPHRLLTATTICTQIITAVSSSQYGGCTITLTHLAPFVRDSYNYYIEKYKKRNLSCEQVLQFAEEDLEKEIQDAVQTFNYQINSMTNTNGQAPFITVFMYLSENPEYTKEIAMLIKEFLLQRIKGMKDETGHYVTQAFPKLIYCLEKKNITEDSEYWWLTKIAAQCTAKRMVPDYISEKVMLEQKIDKNGKGNVYPCMGCRSFLTPFIDNLGNPKYYGRYNCGVCTISLPYIALMSNGNFKKFWEELDKYTELCHKALKISVDRIKETSVNVAPILWKYGAFGRLNSDQKIGNLMFGGYATVSLGYAGLYECVKYMTGHLHFDDGVGKEFGIKVMKFLNEKCDKWKENENISYSLYGTPLEATTYKLAKALKRDFGEIKGITDRNYITNSYHIPVFEEINPFEKLKIESEFQKLSPGGMISYCESANLSHNIEAVLQILQFMYENIMYAELNIKSDYCQACGNEVEMKIIDENGTLDWQCPICGNKDHDKMRVSRRTCGYIGNNYWNQGRTQEIKERYVHIDNHLYKEE